MSTPPVGHEPTVAAQHIDPVCGMTVDADTGQHLDHDGQRYLFCSAHCRTRFQENPDRYTHDHTGQHERTGQHDHTGAASAPPVGEVAEYTCPMHPEIR